MFQTTNQLGKLQNQDSFGSRHVRWAVGGPRWAKVQWPFEEPKSELPATILKATFSGLCTGIIPRKLG